MLIAPILTVLTAVHVKKDLLEMVQFVKVCQYEKVSPATSSSTFYPDYIAFYMKLNAIVIAIDIVSLV